MSGVAVHDHHAVLRQLGAAGHRLAPVDVDRARDVFLGELVGIARVDDEDLLPVLFRDLLGPDQAAAVFGEIQVAGQRIDHGGIFLGVSRAGEQGKAGKQGNERFFHANSLLNKINPGQG
jgi:hypothetical protein